MGARRDDLFKRMRLYVGVTFAFGVISYLAFAKGMPVLITPLAASTCILFAVPNSQFARPKNVILGHVISSAAGVLSNNMLGTNWLASTFCVALAVALMDVTDTMHPPAAATSLIALTTEQGYEFVFTPVGLGACVLVMAAELVKFSLREPKGQ